MSFVCANTMHIVAGDVRKSINIPLIHIAEETTKQIKGNGIKKVGFAWNEIHDGRGFFQKYAFRKRYRNNNSIQRRRDFIHESIFSELGKSIFIAKTKNRYLEIINKLVSGMEQRE